MKQTATSITSSSPIKPWQKLGHWVNPTPKTAVSVLVSALIVWLLLRQIEPVIIWRMLVGANSRWLVVGLGFYLLTNIWRSYRFAALMNIKGIFTPLHLLPDMVLLSFLNNVLPARGGELSFPYLMKKRHGTPVGDSLTYLLIVRIFDLLTIITLFLVFSLGLQGQLVAANTFLTKQLLNAVFLFLLPVLLFLAFLPWLGERGYQLLGWLLAWFQLEAV